MANLISIENVGPIRNQAIEVPEHGGVVVLKGRNGCGKSTALKAARSLVRGSGSLENRQGTVRGEVSGFGAKISVGRSTRRSGELEVETLEGRLDVSQLVDPPHKSAEARDAARIKAIVALTGVKANPSDWYDTVGGEQQFRSLLSLEEAGTDDPLELAARVKRKLESRAREYEADSERLVATIDAHREAAGEGEVATAEAVQKAIDLMRVTGGQLEQCRGELNQALKARERAEESQRKLDTLRKAQTGRGLEAIQGEQTKVVKALAEIERTIADTKSLLANLERELAEEKANQRQLAAEEEAAVRHAALESELQAQLSAPSGDVESLQATLVARAQDHEHATMHLERTSQAKARGDMLAKAAAAEALLKETRRAADDWRGRAKNVDARLSELVACAALTVDGGRLVTATGRGPTLFDELSTGERWKMALEIASTALPPGGLLVIEQEGWEALDPANRDLVAKEAERLGVVILTAEPSEGELRSEVYVGGLDD